VEFAADVFRGKASLPLLQFAGTAGLILNRPVVLALSPGAILDSTRQAQAPQSPFPPMVSPEVIEPLEFDVDDTTFAAA
jgi:hypothetical protein